MKWASGYARLRARATSRLASFLSHKLSQHVRQNPAMSERDELLGRVDACNCLELRRLSLAHGTHGDRPARLQTLRDAHELVGFASRETQLWRRLAALKLQRQHAHVHQIAAMDAFEALGDHRLDAEQQCALRCPVA